MARGPPGGVSQQDDSLDMSHQGRGTRLRRISSMHGCEHLRRLSLSGHAIKRITNVDVLIDLAFLDLSNNRITAIEGVFPLGSLQVLNLSRNDIAALPPALHRLRSLHTLDLSYNRIDGLQHVRVLADMPALRHLSLAGNPLAEERLYPAYVLWKVPQLETLDGKEVTEADRAAARDRLHTAARASATSSPSQRTSPSALSPRSRRRDPMRVGASAGGATPPRRGGVVAESAGAMGGAREEEERGGDGAMKGGAAAGGGGGHWDGADDDGHALVAVPGSEEDEGEDEDGSLSLSRVHDSGSLGRLAASRVRLSEQERALDQRLAVLQRSETVAVSHLAVLRAAAAEHVTALVAHAARSAASAAAAAAAAGGGGGGGGVVDKGVEDERRNLLRERRTLLDELHGQLQAARSVVDDATASEVAAADTLAAAVRSAADAERGSVEEAGVRVATKAVHAHEHAFPPIVALVARLACARRRRALAQHRLRRLEEEAGAAEADVLRMDDGDRAAASAAASAAAVAAASRGEMESGAQAAARLEETLRRLEQGKGVREEEEEESDGQEHSTSPHALQEALMLTLPTRIDSEGESGVATGDSSSSSSSGDAGGLPLVLARLARPPVPGDSESGHAFARRVMRRLRALAQCEEAMAGQRERLQRAGDITLSELLEVADRRARAEVQLAGAEGALRGRLARREHSLLRAQVERAEHTTGGASAALVAARTAARMAATAAITAKQQQQQQQVGVPTAAAAAAGSPPSTPQQQQQQKQSQPEVDSALEGALGSLATVASLHGVSLHDELTASGVGDMLDSVFAEGSSSPGGSGAGASGGGVSTARERRRILVRRASQIARDVLATVASEQRRFQAGAATQPAAAGGDGAGARGDRLNASVLSAVAGTSSGSGATTPFRARVEAQRAMRDSVPAARDAQRYRAATAAALAEAVEEDEAAWLAFQREEAHAVHEAKLRDMSAVELARREHALGRAADLARRESARRELAEAAAVVDGDGSPNSNGTAPVTTANAADANANASASHSRSPLFRPSSLRKAAPSSSSSSSQPADVAKAAASAAAAATATDDESAARQRAYLAEWSHNYARVAPTAASRRPWSSRVDAAHKADHVRPTPGAWTRREAWEKQGELEEEEAKVVDAGDLDVSVSPIRPQPAAAATGGSGSDGLNSTLRTTGSTLALALGTGHAASTRTHRRGAHPTAGGGPQWERCFDEGSCHHPRFMERELEGSGPVATRTRADAERLVASVIRSPSRSRRGASTGKGRSRTSDLRLSRPRADDRFLGRDSLSQQYMREVYEREEPAHRAQKVAAWQRAARQSASFNGGGPTA